jgi:hypothetical protein
MAKVITDRELAEIVNRAVTDPNVIECQDSYLHFLTELGELVANHFGGEATEADAMETQDGVMYTVAFRVNDSVPQDGGIYKGYDRDVSWQGGQEL